MTYITSAERIGIEKGIEKDKLEVAELLLKDGYEMSVVEKISRLSLSQIKALQQKLKDEPYAG